MLKYPKAILLLFFLILLFCNQKQTIKFQLPADVDKIMNIALSHYTKAVQTLTNAAQAPTQANYDGTWLQKETSDWASGFFAGILWHFYDYTHDPIWEKLARRWNAALKQEKFFPKRATQL